MLPSRGDRAVGSWRAAIALAFVACAGGCIETALVVGTVSTTGLEPVTFDHGEGFDTLVMYRMERRSPVLFARGYLYLPPVESVERSAVWNAAGVDPHRSAPAHPSEVRALANKVIAKYELLGAMIERRGIAQVVQIVQPGARYAPTAADLRVYVRLSDQRPRKPEFPDPGRRKHVVAATIVGGDAYDVYVGARSLVIREDAAITEFKPRMLDVLARLERAVTQTE